MKKFNFSILIAVIIMSIASTKAFAHDIEVKNADGVTIYYRWINNKTELAVDYRGTYDVSFYDKEYSGDIIIPESVLYEDKVYRVTSIGYEAFRGNTNLKSISIPKSVINIGEGAFSSCIGLTSVTIPNSVTTIGKWAFSGSGLTSVIIGNSVTSMGSSVFLSCNAITSVEFHCKEIGDWFNGFKTLQYVIIGDEVININKNAFKNCINLTSVNIGNSVTTIGSYAFYNCSINSINIPISVNYIGNAAFAGCKNLTSVNISDVSKWCNISFGNYHSNPISLSQNLFVDGKEVRELVIPNSVTVIKEFAFYNCSGLTSVVIGNSVASIGNHSFAQCSGLTSVIIGDSVTSIGEMAFYNCKGLSSVTISKSIRSIENQAFDYCSLKDMYCYAETPPKTIGNPFKWDKLSETTLHVPLGSIDAYKSQNIWKNFGKIVGINQTDVQIINLDRDVKTTIYNLNGRKLESPQKGINIIGGKKVVVK